MNNELKQKWIDALLSGNYEQGKKMLRSSENKFCCLGVLCDIIDPDAWRNDYGPECYTWEKGRFSYLPQEILDKIGLTNKQQQRLAFMNDDEVSNYSFEDIANWIKENV